MSSVLYTYYSELRFILMNVQLITELLIILVFVCLWVYNLLYSWTEFNSLTELILFL